MQIVHKIVPWTISNSLPCGLRAEVEQLQSDALALGRVAGSTYKPEWVRFKEHFLTKTMFLWTIRSFEPMLEIPARMLQDLPVQKNFWNCWYILLPGILHHGSRTLVKNLCAPETRNFRDLPTAIWKSALCTKLFFTAGLGHDEVYPTLQCQ